MAMRRSSSVAIVNMEHVAPTKLIKKLVAASRSAWVVNVGADGAVVEEDEDAAAADVDVIAAGIAVAVVVAVVADSPVDA